MRLIERIGLLQCERQTGFKERMLPVEFPDWIARLGPRVPLESLVEEVNKIYHSFDASRYDREHPEIHEQLPPIWDEMIAQLPHSGPWNVFNLGCGTGFEASQLLNRLGDKVRKLVTYDPSPEMATICRTRLQRFPQAVFCLGLGEVQSHGPYNLLLTNSLLHHLPNIEETITPLLSYLTPDAMWLAGHEPSVRFYRNEECVKLLERYHRHRKYAKWFQYSNYTAKLQMLSGRHPLSSTATVAYKQGIFSKRPGEADISRIVDFHVAHSADEVSQGRGLDIEKMQASFQRDWKLDWSITYSFLGPHTYASAPDSWIKRAQLLEKRFPDDGANFCTVWQRKTGSVNTPSTQALL